MTAADTIRTEREKLSERIRQAVTDAAADFTRATGALPTSVQVQFLERRHLVGRTEVVVDRVDVDISL